MSTRRFGTTKGQKLFLAFAGVCAFLVLLAAGNSIKKYIDSLAETTEGFDQSKLSLEELSDPTVFLKEYMQVNCNEATMAKAQTVRISGNTKTPNASQEFTLTKKRPNLMRVKIVQDKVEYTIGVHGQNVWKRIRVPKQPDHLQLIAKEYTKPWLVQSRFFDNIINVHLGTGRIDSIGASDYESNTYLKVSIRTQEEDLIKVLVDPDTMHPFAEIKTNEKGQEETTFYSNYQDVDGMPLPFYLKTEVEGNITQEVIIDSAKMNGGVLSGFFDVPEELEVL
ncbi:MAG: hypothetical protein ACSHYA_00750 [Opitutaceae bacterium]